MANNQYVNKVVFGNDILIDISNDTVIPNAMLQGFNAHDKSGASISGNIPLYQYNEGVNFDTYGNIEILSGCHAIYQKYQFSKIQLQVPESGTNSFIIAVPNGTTTPDPTNDDDWIPITFSVDTQGNSTVIDDTIPATGVSF